ncbi:hypothetical protein U9M48_010966 [Paspalum notatum var. saurae]|uniref:Uncharacterized protein n=1 Tax=Paspalum notatum var. saurae TaxID=547442 RepID=A0AAQ3SUH1_PASNO
MQLQVWLHGCDAMRCKLARGHGMGTAGLTLLATVQEVSKCRDLPIQEHVPSSPPESWLLPRNSQSKANAAQGVL